MKCNYFCTTWIWYLTSDVSYLQTGLSSKSRYLL